MMKFNFKIYIIFSYSEFQKSDNHTEEEQKWQYIPLQEALGLLKKRHLLVVDKEWLMESIGGWEIRSLMPHEDEEAEEQKWQ